jgi:hypothetical protein
MSNEVKGERAMDDTLSTHQARRVWGISNHTLYSWIDDGTLELTFKRGKPFVRIADEITDDEIKVIQGVGTLRVGTLRGLASVEAQESCEAHFIWRSLAATPMAAIIGLFCGISGAAGAGRPILGAFIGVGAGLICFSLLLLRAIWLLWVARRAKAQSASPQIKAGESLPIPSLTLLWGKTLMADEEDGLASQRAAA